MLNAMEDVNWESELAALLARLSAAQRELLSLLSTKREMIVERDHNGLAALAAREGELAAELQACQARRLQLLAEADRAGLTAGSLA
jgi:hypothetical protein